MIDPGTASVIGSVLGIGGSLWGNNQQMQQQQQLMQQQQANQMALNNQMQQIQQENWNYTNFENQLKHLKNAGLSVGLMYGKGGAGGTTMGGASGGNAGLGQAPQNVMPQAMALFQQSLMQQSQIELNRAQANKLDAEAKKIGDTDTRLGEKQIESLAQGIENQKAVLKLTQIETDLKGVEYDLKYATLEDNIGIVKNELNKGFRQIYILEKEGLIKNEEALVKRRELSLKLAGMSAENILTRATTNLTNEKVEQVKQDVINSIGQTWAMKKNALTNEQMLWNEQDKRRLQERLGEMGLDLQEQGQILNLVGTIFGAGMIGTKPGATINYNR